MPSGQSVNILPIFPQSIGISEEDYFNLLRKISDELNLNEKKFSGRCGKYYYKYANETLVISEKSLTFLNQVFEDETRLSKDNCEYILSKASQIYC